MRNILIVEDEMLSREGIVELLSRKYPNYSVHSARNGAEGLSIATSLQPQLIISDVKMPDMDGLSMIGGLKETGCRSKVLFLSGYAEFAYAQSALRLGAEDYLLKPVVPSQLFRAVESCLYGSARQAAELPQENGSLGREGVGVLLYPFRCGSHLMPGWRELLLRYGAVICDNASPANALCFTLPDAKMLPQLSRRLSVNEPVVLLYEETSLQENAVGFFTKLYSYLPWSIVRRQNLIRMGECTAEDKAPSYSAVQRRVHQLFHQGRFPECLEELSAYLRALPPGSGNPAQVLRALTACLQPYPAGHLSALGLDESVAYAQAVTSVLQANTLPELTNTLTAYFRLGTDASRHATPYSKPVYVAMEEVRRHYAEKISLRSIADKLGITPQYLCRVFAKEFTRSFSDFVTDVRMENACLLLRDGSMKIYDIARRVGYTDEKYFSTLFKKALGKTPVEYRYTVMAEENSVGDPPQPPCKAL